MPHDTSDTVSGSSSHPSHSAERLRDRLRLLSMDQLVEAVEDLLALLETKERLAFISRLPAIPVELLAAELPYDTEEDLLIAIEEFVTRVRNREFVEYEGYDR